MKAIACKTQSIILLCFFEEVSVYTDVRDPDKYKLNLSKNRAVSTLEYLVSQGVERSRLKSIEYVEIPHVHRWGYDYSNPQHDVDFVPQNVPLKDGEEELHH